LELWEGGPEQERGFGFRTGLRSGEGIFGERERERVLLDFWSFFCNFCLHNFHLIAALQIAIGTMSNSDFGW
jgi:hypothetical protein